MQDYGQQKTGSCLAYLSEQSERCGKATLRDLMELGPPSLLIWTNNQTVITLLRTRTLGVLKVKYFLDRCHHSFMLGLC
jgi:hypothetical protein